MTTAVRLTRGMVAYVDAIDAANVLRFKWHYDGRYAATNIGRVRLRMHNYLCVGDEIDHIDGDPLNNTRANLRAVDHHQNSANRGMSKSNTSGFKGVSWEVRRGYWRAHISPRGKMIQVGAYDDLIEAACAYNGAARKHFGPFARLNRMD